MQPLDNPTPPADYTVNPSIPLAQVLTFVRDLGVIVTFVTALLGFIGKRDLMGLVAYVQSDVALPAIAALATIGLVVWRQFLTIKNKKIAIRAAEAPNTGVEFK